VLVPAVLAAAVEVVLVARAGVPLGPLCAVGAALGGHLLGYRHRVPALLLAAAAPVLATATGWNPVVDWTMAVFTALLLTVRGMSGALVGVVLGVANLAAVAWFGGTLDVHANPSASIAAFAAVVGAAAGSAVRDHDRYLAELRGRERDAVATRAAAVDRGVAEERLRIARDLHDGIGHHMALISMRLGAAEVRLPPDADEVRADLAAARADLQDVLAETQRVLRVLRVGSPDAAGAPTPHHSRIPELVRSSCEAGLQVDADLGDLPATLAPEISAAAYRISQELLTNAHRHGAGTASFRVSVQAGGPDDPGALVIESENERASVAPHGPGSGYGLIGLRERAESVGGHVDIRPDGDRFRVRAVLPLSGGTS
jgi:signal transduction histidine kinase